MNYEDEIIDPILNLIQDNQRYLCKIENLPQLAKLGYIFNSLYYAGRFCWGFEGHIEKLGECESNPKDKISQCEAICEKYDNLIYDAWGMHIEKQKTAPNWDTFSNIIFGHTEFSDFDLKYRKINKTFDEWVEVLTDVRCEYHSIYPNRRAVANHMLCIIGNGYKYKKGYIVKTASGADVDIDLYGFWENAVFLPKIEHEIRNILSKDIVKQTISTAFEIISQNNQSENEYEEDVYECALKLSLINENVMTSEECECLSLKELQSVFREKIRIQVEKQFKYYPIYKGHSIVTKLNKKSHPSYITAAIEICQDILNKKELYLENEKESIIFVKQFIKKYEKV